MMGMRSAAVLRCFKGENLPPVWIRRRRETDQRWSHQQLCLRMSVDCLDTFLVSWTHHRRSSVPADSGPEPSLPSGGGSRATVTECFIPRSRKRTKMRTRRRSRRHNVRRSHATAPMCSPPLPGSCERSEVHTSAPEVSQPLTHPFRLQPHPTAHAALRLPANPRSRVPLGRAKVGVVQSFATSKAPPRQSEVCNPRSSQVALSPPRISQVRADYSSARISYRVAQALFWASRDPPTGPNHGGPKSLLTKIRPSCQSLFHPVSPAALCHQCTAGR